MLNRRSFLASLTSTLALIAAWRPARAQATHSTRVTFVLFNDFYIMGDVSPAVVEAAKEAGAAIKAAL